MLWLLLQEFHTENLTLQGLKNFTAAGVHYGAAMVQTLSYKGENVYIVGGANSAGQAAIYIFLNIQVKS
jgi:thioredoxin reductase (NADPH)